MRNRQEELTVAAGYVAGSMFVLGISSWYLLKGRDIGFARRSFAVAAGFVALGIFPTLAVLVVVQILYRSLRYAVAKPTREVLFTVVDREEKYKSKAFIDAAVYRGGDLINGWIYAGLAALGMTVGAIALVAAPVAGLWALIGLQLGLRAIVRHLGKELCQAR